MELAVSYLAGLGHRKIAYLSSSLGARVLQARHAAFLRSMHQHGLKTSPAAIGCSYYLSECMEKHLPRFLENGITAIICNQDTLASATLTQCQQLGFQIPDDISIIGFDDLPIAACTSPPLTTIRQDRLELGKSGFFVIVKSSQSHPNQYVFVACTADSAGIDREGSFINSSHQQYLPVLQSFLPMPV